MVLTDRAWETWVVAESWARALDAHGVERALVDLGRDRWTNTVRGLLQWPEGAPYASTLLVDAAEDTHSALMRIPLAAKVRGLRACWLWDLDGPPRWHPYWTEAFEEVWAPTRFVADALRELDVPVRLVPPPLLFGTPGRELGGPARGATAVVLAILDLGGDLERQDPYGLVELAHALAREGLHAEVHCLLLRSDRNPELADQLENQARGLPLRVERAPTSRSRVEERLARAAAFVSLDRGLGLPLGAILAAGAGTPIVATAYGGVLDFLDEDSGYPVRWKEHLRPSARAVGPWIREAVPDVSHAVERMAELLGDRARAREKAADAHRRAVERFGGASPSALAGLGELLSWSRTTGREE
jgi:hypothetical protein